MLLLLVSLYPLYLTYVLSQNDITSKSLIVKYTNFVRIYWTSLSLITLLETYIGGFWGFVGWFKLCLLLSLYSDDISAWFVNQVGLIDSLMMQYVPAVWRYDKQLQQQLFGTFRSNSQTNSQHTRQLSIVSQTLMWLQSGFGGFF